MPIFSSGFRDPDRERLVHWQGIIQERQRELWNRHQGKSADRLTAKDLRELTIFMAQMLGLLSPVMPLASGTLSVAAPLPDSATTTPVPEFADSVYERGENNCG
jgi:hypothetical protein